MKHLVVIRIDDKNQIFKFPTKKSQMSFVKWCKRQDNIEYSYSFGKIKPLLRR